MLRFAIQSAILYSLIASAGLAGQSSCPASAGVGFRVMKFGAMKTAVWYPSTGPESPYRYSAKTSGSVALNATPMSCQRFPLVIFSHGYGGCGAQSVFITEQLARSGFIVAAPDYADAGCSVDGAQSSWPPKPEVSFLDPANWTDQTYIDRKVDIQNALDGMLQSPVFGPIADASRIAGMGHSLGGYTILGLIGAGPSWLEPRIRAAILLSPYSQPFLARNTLGDLRVPVMYQGGTLDFGITPSVSKNAGAYDNSPAPKYFVDLHAAGHFAWTNFARMRSGSTAQCLATVPNAKLIDGYALAFLQGYIEQQNAPLLSGQGAGLAEYRRAP
jgi:predicted dienelactone hydrolase